MEEKTLAITMWDFSWLERRWPGAGYEDWDKALDDLKQRGYDAVRIDAYPHLCAIDPYKEWELLPTWNQQDWGSPAINRVQIQPALNQFIRKCAQKNIKVALSTWYRVDKDNSVMQILTPEQQADMWIKTLTLIARDDLLDNILYVDLCNEWPLQVWAPFFEPEKKERSWTSQESMEWMQKVVKLVREKFPKLKYCFSLTDDFDKWQDTDVSFFDILELHLWMAQCNNSEFYQKIDYNYERFEPTGYENLVKFAEELYLTKPEYWLNELKSEIQNLAKWSETMNLPIVTTECWGIVDYKDWPLLNWGWVKEICEYGVLQALATGRWMAMGTSNFCGPQFHGMWDDVNWHKNLTDKIHESLPIFLDEKKK